MNNQRFIALAGLTLLIAKIIGSITGNAFGDPMTDFMITSLIIGGTLAGLLLSMNIRIISLLVVAITFLSNTLHYTKSIDQLPDDITQFFYLASYVITIALLLATVFLVAVLERNIRVHAKH
jgi:hypothetical protein